VYCFEFELLMMGGETAQNMYSTDSNKEYCKALHLVGYTWKNTLMMHGPMNVKFSETAVHLHLNCSNVRLYSKVVPVNTIKAHGGVEIQLH
jgi:hypothetical protein